MQLSRLKTLGIVAAHGVLAADVGHEYRQLPIHGRQHAFGRDVHAIGLSDVVLGIFSPAARFGEKPAALLWRKVKVFPFIRRLMVATRRGAAHEMLIFD